MDDKFNVQYKLMLISRENNRDLCRHNVILNVMQVKDISRLVCTNKQFFEVT